MDSKFVTSAPKNKPVYAHNQHRMAIPDMIKEVVRISDIVLQVVDARFFEKMRNTEIEQLISDMGKKTVFVLNKADLVDIDELKEKVAREKMHPYVILSCKSKVGMNVLRTRIKIEVKRLNLKEGYRAQIGIVGYPNVGKSSLINMLAGRRASGTSEQAGFTKTMSKIRFSKNILILDTPGVIPDGELNSSTEKKKKHTEIGAQHYNKIKAPDFFVANLMKENPGVFEEYYGVQANGDSELLLETLAKKRGMVLKKGAVDLDRMARLVIKAWQEGKIKSR